MIKKLINFLLGKKQQVAEVAPEESTITVEPPKEVAKVIPLFDKDLEFKDLEEKHMEYFSIDVPPLEQMQSQIGPKKEARSNNPNIRDVNPSRSTKFFQEAPQLELDDEVKEDFDEITSKFTDLEQYHGIPIYQGEEDLDHEEKEIEKEDDVLTKHFFHKSS